jgi:tRNA pseudouridine55 synthase
VSRLRRTSGERSIGHTGTLDPRATGLLPLVLGRATRLASLLTGRDKTYEATIRLGLATDTDDADGKPIGEPVTALPADEVIAEALSRFAGTLLQVPPAHSAKKIAGRKAYELARREQPVELAPVEVTVREIAMTRREGDTVGVRVTASAGFYVRSLARDLGAALGCGGHLLALRRTASGSFTVDQALPLEEAERLGRDVVGRVIPPAEAVGHLPGVTIGEPGLRRVRHGNPIGPEYTEGRWIPAPAGALPVRVLDAGGTLVALAHVRGGALHPVVVLG